MHGLAIPISSCNLLLCSGAPTSAPHEVPSPRPDTNVPDLAAPAPAASEAPVHASQAPIGTGQSMASSPISGLV